MDNLRNNIDKIDQQLMELLNKRFTLTTRIGEIKAKANKKIKSKKREAEILSKTNQFFYNNTINDIYKLILKKSRDLQTHYGLIGKSLPYSLSPLIYQKLGLNIYNIVEIDQFKEIEEINFKGLNVTIPFKTDAYRYCKQLDESAIITKTVNTIVEKRGYNTDYLAFKEIFKKHNLDFENKKVVIIGNGATSRSVKEAINNDAVFLVRTVRNENEYPLSNYNNFNNCDYLINTTPYGTFPKTENKPLFPLDKFTNLKMVIDVIYNPLNSPLILEAKKYNIKTMNGLELLVTQANLSYNLMLKKKINKVQKIINELNNDLYNIVLIGMPFSGKSTLARLLSKKVNKELIDIDNILKNEDHDLETLSLKKISIFREYETKTAIKYGSLYNQVIAPGGGIVESEEAMYALKRNSVVIFVNSPLDELIKRIDNTRPLINNKNDLLKLYKKRLPLYQKYKDIEITNEEDIKEVVVRINEYFSN